MPAHPHEPIAADPGAWTRQVGQREVGCTRLSRCSEIDSLAARKQTAKGCEFNVWTYYQWPMVSTT